MAKSVENRVVQMTFDNVLFERKLSETIRSLDSLKKSIDGVSAAEGLKDIGKHTKSLDVSGITNGLSSVNKSFLALGAVAFSVINNITSRAVDAGIRLARSLSLDQITSGFGEYETNMRSIQTILANTRKDATTLEDVNAALDELNAYADLTIYNFAEMTRNIGTFTAAGVDLDTSVRSIKGIANVAAISGSSSQQASVAMYQLSQAIASGTLKLMDWNSVVNAGMGGEVLQEALFETGKAMGTIVGVPMTRTFEEWKDAGNSFRESLQDGWITADVLTTTLEGFTGEMTEAELAAKGFSAAQIKNIQELGAVGVEAATKVRTLTQLIDTAKEAVGSGWSLTFRLLLGDFEEATELFTGISEAFGDFAAASADSRNALISDWRDLGGRQLALEALKNSFLAVVNVVRPIKEAFRQIFPPQTAKTLFDLTAKFYAFSKSMEPSFRTVVDIRNTFQGFFSILKVGWEVIKEGTKFVKELVEEFTGLGNGEFLKFMGNFGLTLKEFSENLVEGGGIKKFFDDLRAIVDDPLAALEKYREKIRLFFEEEINTDSLGVVGAFLDRLKQRFEGFERVISGFSGVWDGFVAAVGAIKDYLVDLWGYIKDWFGSLGSRIAESFSETDFDGALDVVNAGLITGIALLIADFVKNGLDFGFADEIGSSVAGMFDAVTETLVSFQSKLQADTLLRLAIAIGALTASIVILSLIDSAALSKALAAMSVGFGQLVGAMFALTKLSVSLSGFGQVFALSASLIALASALLLLSIGLKILSTIDAADMAVALGTLSVMLLGLVLAMERLDDLETSMFSTGLAILAIAGAIFVLSVSMKILATMTWEEIAKGLVGVAAGLTGLVLALQYIPANTKGLLKAGVSMLFMAGALVVLGVAMKIFATMSWEEIGKGLAATAGALLILAGAMHLMPKSMPLTAAGLILVAGALNLIAVAMRIIAGLSWEELARGLIGIGYSIGLLAAAALTMQGAVGGAAAMFVMSLGLLAIASALKIVGDLSIAQIVTGLITMAATLGIFAGAAMLLQPAVVPMLAIGAAVLVLGAGLLLLGAGAALAVSAMLAFAALSGKAIASIIRGIGQLIAALPDFVTGLVEAFGELVVELTKYVPVFVEFFKELISNILTAIVELTPQVVETLITVISGLLETIRELAPEFIETGLFLLISLLEGIRDNIGEIATIVIEILTEFLNAVADNVGDLIEAGKNVIISLIQGITDSLIDIQKAGVEALLAFAKGIADNVILIVDQGFQIIIDFINSLADTIEKRRGELAAAGLNLVDAILGGILEKALEIMSWAQGLISDILGWIGDRFSGLTQKGRDIINGLFNGMKAVWTTVSGWFRGLAERVLGYVGSGLTWLYDVGKNIITGLWNGIFAMKDWFIGKLKGAMTAWIPGPIKDVLGIRSPSRVTGAIGEDLARGLIVGVERGMEINSPSKAMMRIGQGVTEGLALGVLKGDDAHVAGIQLADELVLTFRSGLARALDAISGMEEFTNPVITPVLDLTNIRSGAGELRQLMDTSGTYASALGIAQTRIYDDVGDETSSGSVVFNQTINAPKQLSTSDIYRQTRTQINVAKEELSIP